SERCPSCKAPIVGTSPSSLPCPRRPIARDCISSAFLIICIVVFNPRCVKCGQRYTTAPLHCATLKHLFKNRPSRAGTSSGAQGRRHIARPAAHCTAPEAKPPGKRQTPACPAGCLRAFL